MLLSTQEAAEVLGVEPSRVRSLIKTGKIEAFQDPRSYKWGIKRTHLRKYVRSGASTRGRRRFVDES